jgi:hypothetical protein
VVIVSRYTTVQLEKGTKEKLAEMREYSRETYDEIVNKLIKIAELVQGDEGELTEEAKKAIARGRADFKAGRSKPLTQVIKELGLD